MTSSVDPYDHTEREVIAAIEKAQRRHALRPLMVALLLLIGLGGLSAYFSIRNAIVTTSASQDAAERQATLTSQLTALTQQFALDQQQQNASAVADRNDSRRLQLALCDQVEAIARQVHLTVPPCPRVPLPPPGPATPPPGAHRSGA